MDLILLLLIMAVFILPSFFMMRSQRRRQAELQNMQASVGVGDRVVTVSGIHGTITAEQGDQITVEIAPSVDVTMDRIAVLRKATPQDLGTTAVDPLGTAPADPDEAGYRHPEYPTETDQPDHRPDGGHPENR